MEDEASGLEGIAKIRAEIERLKRECEVVEGLQRKPGDADSASNQPSAPNESEGQQMPQEGLGRPGDTQYNELKALLKRQMIELLDH